MRASGKLILVATPIGNRADISARALEALKAADLVLAEDTRVSASLLASYQIKTHIERCDERCIAQRSASLVKRIIAGENMALCSDAGMPAISDPGAVLVDACRASGVEVEVIPGPSAVTTAVAAAGFARGRAHSPQPPSSFYFAGFVPRKHASRLKLFSELAQLPALLVFFESPHRVCATLRALACVMPERKVAFCRELTKLHEEVLRDFPAALADKLEARSSIKGEIVLVVQAPLASRQKNPPEWSLLDERILRELDSGAKKSELASRLAAETGFSKNQIYKHLLEL